MLDAPLLCNNFVFTRNRFTSLRFGSQRLAAKSGSEAGRRSKSASSKAVGR
jgi:hypothetical protein